MALADRLESLVQALLPSHHSLGPVLALMLIGAAIARSWVMAVLALSYSVLAFGLAGPSTFVRPPRFTGWGLAVLLVLVPLGIGCLVGYLAIGGWLLLSKLAAWLS